jgi:GT2 family glycosyltransferase
MKIPLISIVIPTHNRKDMLLRLIQSVLASDYKNIEIIIVNDASSDSTHDVLNKKYGKNKRVYIVTNKKNLYTAGSRNIGAKAAKGEFIFFIDDDNVVAKNLISMLVAEFMKDSQLGEVGPVNYSYSKKNKILWARTKRNMTTSMTNQSRSIQEFGRLKTWKTDDIPNAFMVRKKVIEKHSIYFREKYGIMYEESDFAYRIREAGYTIKVVKGAKIYHDVEYSDGVSKNKDYMYHFMENKRRPYVTARNRILFHSFFSTKIQLFGIMVIWMWVFAAYYSYKILSYSGYGKFSLIQRLDLISWYFRGIFSGIGYIVGSKKFIL